MDTTSLSARRVDMMYACITPTSISAVACVTPFSGLMSMPFWGTHAPNPSSTCHSRRTCREGTKSVLLQWGVDTSTSCNKCLKCGSFFCLTGSHHWACSGCYGIIDPNIYIILFYQSCCFTIFQFRIANGSTRVLFQLFLHYGEDVGSGVNI